tara:strand:+ start:17 stop:1060 length:1044 start_codon:yes stop_codon:yes gene_type:complete
MAQFTTGYDNIPIKPKVGPASISKGIANRLGLRNYTLKNVDTFQKTLLKYIDENRWDKTFQLELWGLHNDKVPSDWKALIGITLAEIEVPPPLGKGKTRREMPESSYDTTRRRVRTLTWCIQNGYNIMAIYLINKVYSVSNIEDYNTEDYNTKDILFIAIEKGNKEVITELLDNGADPNIKEEITGKTPLILAIEDRNVELVKELLNHDADPNIKNEITGKIPLILAIENRNVELVKELLTHEADPNIKDNNGRSAINAAKDTEHKDIIRLLRPFSTVVNELRQDMRSNGVSRTKDNNKYLSVVAYPPLSKKIQGYLGEGGKRKKTNKKRKLIRKTIKRKTKKNNKK